MLYRQPRPFAVRLMRAAIARLAGFAADFRRIGADRVYLDRLDEEALRDLGIRRIDGRDVRFYR